MSDSKIDTLISEALDNIRSDRKVAKEFLNEIANQIANNAEENKYLSPVAAKHIETMQRSNEQLVKIINLKQKGSVGTVELNQKEKDELFDLIQGDLDGAK